MLHVRSFQGVAQCRTAAPLRPRCVFTVATRSACGARAQRAQRAWLVCRAEEREGGSAPSSEASSEGGTPGAQAEKPRALYADEVAKDAMPKKDPMSTEMKKKLREEYIGLGGSENRAMGANYFLWIGIVVAVLAVLTKLTGAI